MFWQTKKYHKSTLYIDKSFNSPRKCDNYEHIGTKEKGIIAQKTIRLEGDIQFYNGSWKI